IFSPRLVLVLPLLRLLHFFLSSRSRPPISPLFPYTTLFRSLDAVHRGDRHVLRGRRRRTLRLARFDRAEDGERRHRRTKGHRLRSEEHTSELQSHLNLVCRLLLEKKNKRRQQSCTILVHTAQ